MIRNGHSHNSHSFLEYRGKRLVQSQLMLMERALALASRVLLSNGSDSRAYGL